MPNDETPDVPPGGVVDVFEDEEFTQRVLKLGAKQAIALGLDGTYRRHQKIVVIGTFVIDDIGHKDVGGKPTRVESGSSTELFIVSDSTDALDLLQRARAEREAALDQLLGRERLPFDDQPSGPAETPPPPGDPDVRSMTDDEFEQSLNSLLDSEGDKTDEEFVAGLESALDGEPPEPDPEGPDDPETTGD